MSGERACLSAYQKPPVSNRVEVTGPVLNRRYCEPRPDRAMRLRDAVVGVIAGAFADRVEIEMVLHVAADARKIVNNRHPGGLAARRRDRFRRAEAAAASRSRRNSRSPRARREGLDSAPCATSTPTARPFSTSIFKRLRVQPDREVGARPRRLEKGARRRRSLGVARR